MVVSDVEHTDLNVDIDVPVMGRAAQQKIDKSVPCL